MKMKRTLILSKDSCNYYYIILEDGEKVKEGHEEYSDYENCTEELINDLEGQNGKCDFIYWI